MIWTDLKYSARSLARSPGLTTMLLLTIALGIGSNAAVAGFVRGLVTRDLPIAEIGRVVSVFARDSQNSFGPLSLAEYQSLKIESNAFELLGVARETRSAVVLDDRSTVLSVAAITPDLAALLQLSFVDGVVVSNHVWHSEFGGRTDMRGQSLRLDDNQTQVAGVAPEWLDGLYAGDGIDVWTPLQETAIPEIERSGQNLWALGRLRSG